MKEYLKRFAAFLIASAMSAALCACGVSDPAESAENAENGAQSGKIISFTDDLGREVSITRPTRVAAMIGSFADIWCLAGGRDSLVAAASDTWTGFDLGLDEAVVNIGGVKTPSLELLLASKPELILASCNTTANLEMREIWDNAELQYAFFDIQNIDDYLNMLSACTRLTGHEESFEEYGAAVKARAEAAIARQDGTAPTVLCMRATGLSCKVKSSVDNLLGEMLFDLGCVNVADSDTSLLEELSLEAIMEADPEYIFVVLQGADPTRATETLEQTFLSNPAWQQLTAVKEGRFYTLEHELYNLKPNARWGEAYEKLADILYAEE